jgi:hypothetical protein
MYFNYRSLETQSLFCMLYTLWQNMYGKFLVYSLTDVESSIQ